MAGGSGAILARMAFAAAVLVGLSGCVSLNPFGGGAPDHEQAAALGAQGAATGDPRVARLEAEGVVPLSGPELASYMDQLELATRKALNGTEISVARVGQQLVLTIPTGTAFANGSAELQPVVLPALTAVAGVLGTYGRTLVDVYGYTDSQGPEAYNLDLSQRRAVAVATRLSASGIDQKRFYIEGKGEAAPIASNATEAGRAQNRRVEIRIAPIAEG